MEKESRRKEQLKPVREAYEAEQKRTARKRARLWRVRVKVS